MQRKLVAPIAWALVLLSAILFTACEGRSPSAPSLAVSPEPSRHPSPAPTPSPLVGLWNLTLRMTAVTGSGCVAETMQSQVGVPHSYSLSIVQNGYSSLKVILKSTSGNRECTFTPVVDSTGFTTYGKPGYYTCEEWYLDFRCGDGTLHSIFTIGEDISGRVSGNEISGAWDASWFDGWDDNTGVEMKAQFTGVRQTAR